MRRSIRIKLGHDRFAQLYAIRSALGVSSRAKFLPGEDRSMTKRLIPLILLCFFLTNLAAQTKPTPAADEYNAIFKALKWRSIGPFRGGRSNCGSGVVGDPKTYYMGTTGGGLWKTEDMGISWRN